MSEDENKEVDQIIAAEKEETTPPPELSLQDISKKHRLKNFFRSKKGKVITAIVGLVVVIGVLFAIPVTRYGILGPFIKRNVHVVIADSTTAKPVSDANVAIGDASAQTNANGEADLSNIPVGQYTAKVTKSYYTDLEQSYEVPVFGDVKEMRASLVATGRQVVLNVTNKITSANIMGVTISASGVKAITDDKGVVTLVLPADKEIVDGTLSLDGYNSSTVKVKVTDQASANSFTLTPAGTVHYLSKKTGKINVMKSNLDGTDAKVVVQGTGNEMSNSTTLLATSDWQYAVLAAERKSDKPGLYLVNTKHGTMSTIDEGSVTFRIVGWSGHTFTYVVNRDRNEWESGQQALKSYDADSGKITTIDETAASGSNDYDYQHESMQNTYIVDGKVVFSKTWFCGPNTTCQASNRKAAILVSGLDGGGKQRIKEFTMSSYTDINGQMPSPQKVIFSVNNGDNNPVFYEYEAGAIKGITTTSSKFYNTFYPVYLTSPNGQKTFWYEPRDGKNVLFIGDKYGQNGKEIAAQSEHAAYGWYGDDYILLSKNSSELYIASANSTITDSNKLLKVTDYHKPGYGFSGYGYSGQ